VIRGDIELVGDLIQDPVRIGLNADTLPDTVGIGRNVVATGTDSTATGTGAIANNGRTVAYGKGAEATGQDATAIGTETTAPSNWNTVIGYDAGSSFNGENVVLVGRKSEARGDDTVAIGEDATANGNQSTVVGKATRAVEDNASAFGQASEALGENTTVVGRGVTVDTSDSTSVGVGVNVTGVGATVVGVNGEATADNATALGNGAVAQGTGSIAIGQGTTVSLASAIGFGDRDIALQNTRSVLYPTNAGAQTLANIPVDDTVSAGVRQEFTFDIGGESIFVVRAETDGTGGIQNAVGEIKGSFALEGDTNQVDDIITGDISIQDPSGNEQVGLDATSTPVEIDLHNNRLLNFGIRSGEDITYPDDSGVEQLVDFNVSSASGLGDEMSYSFAVNDSGIAKIFAEADGSGGIQNQEFRLLENINVNSNDLVDGSNTIWDSGNGYIPLSALESDTVSLSAGTGISGGGDFSLGGSAVSISLTNTDVTINGQNGLNGGTVSLGSSVNIGVSGSFELDSDLVSNSGGSGAVIWDESEAYIPQGRLQNSSVTVSTGTDLTGGGGVSLGSSTTINHANTSNQGNVSTGGATVIDDINLDGRGHVTNLNTQNRSLDDWANPNSRLDLDGNGIDFDDQSNSDNARGAINIGFVDFQNEEWSNTPQNSSTLAYDASEGFLMNDDLDLSGSLNEGAAL
jgi:Hep_Hag.